MRNILTLLVFIFFNITLTMAQEISLFDSNGKPVAYVDTDDDLTIYLWSGKPVAYLSNDNIYGFNGKHIGWWIDGIIRNHDGNVVGVMKGAINMYTEYEPYKGYKEYKPSKNYKEYAPYKPYWSNSWSTNPFKIFLLQGIDD